MRLGRARLNQRIVLVEEQLAIVRQKIEQLADNAAQLEVQLDQFRQEREAEAAADAAG